MSARAKCLQCGGSGMSKLNACARCHGVGLEPHPDSAPGWTEDRVALLKKLWAEGHSCSAISNRLGGTTRNAVIGKVTRLGLSGRAIASRPVKRPPKLAMPRPRQLRDDGAGGEEHLNDQLDREICTLIDESCAPADIAEAYPERGLKQVKALAKEIAAA